MVSDEEEQFWAITSRYQEFLEAGVMRLSGPSETASWMSRRAAFMSTLNQIDQHTADSEENLASNLIRVVCNGEPEQSPQALWSRV